MARDLLSGPPMHSDLTHSLALLLDPADAPKRASRLLERLTSPLRLGLASTHALAATRLVSPAEAERIRAAFALAAAALAAPPAAPLTAPELVAAAVPELWTSPSEELWVVAVDSGLRPVCRDLAARGGPASCAARPTDVLRRVVVAGATGLFLLHNHPSGDPTPSRQDRRFTDEVARRARDLDLQLHDHLVVGGLSWASCVTAAVGTIDPALRRPRPATGRTRRRPTSSGALALRPRLRRTAS